MRPALIVGLALAAAPTAGLAQTPPYAAITDAETKLRAGPSDQFPETANLPRGATVFVDHEEPNGWLAVQDPPGRVYSVSWVQASFVDFDNTKPTPQNVMVADDTTLAAGQIGLAQPMTHVRRAKVPAGTVLTVIGAKVQFEGKWWHPVAPPAGDFRYVPKQAVRYDKPAAAAFTVRDSVPPAAPAAGATPPAGPATPPPVVGTVGSRPPLATEPTPGTTSGKPAVQHPLWAQAEAAERDGRLDEAEKLFFQLARLMNDPGGDHDIANLCYTRIHTLREKKRGVGNGAPVKGPLGEPTRPAGSTPTAPAVDARDDRPRWTGPGRLVRSALALEGRKTYALESNPGVPVAYVVAGTGLNLDQYVGRRVDVYGSSYSRRDLQRPYVVATAVEPAP